jgi:hypothetical protein
VCPGFRVYNSNVSIELAKQMEWGSLADSLMNQEDLLGQMRECSMSNAATCSLSPCLPCYCAGLQAVSTQHETDGYWIQGAKYQCADYIETLDVKSLALR